MGCSQSNSKADLYDIKMNGDDDLTGVGPNGINTTPISTKSKGSTTDRGSPNGKLRQNTNDDIYISSRIIESFTGFSPSVSQSSITEDVDETDGAVRTALHVLGYRGDIEDCDLNTICKGGMMHEIKAGNDLTLIIDQDTFKDSVYISCKGSFMVSAGANKVKKLRKGDFCDDETFLSTLSRKHSNLRGSSNNLIGSSSKSKINGIFTNSFVTITLSFQCLKDDGAILILSKDKIKNTIGGLDSSNTTECSDDSAIDIQKDEELIDSKQLMQFPLLSTLSENAIIETCKTVRVLRRKSGSIIVTPGDETDNFYLIAMGRVKVIGELGMNGQKTRGYTLSKGQYFGEGPILYGNPRTASITASTDVILYVLNKESFQSLMDKLARP